MGARETAVAEEGASDGIRLYGAIFPGRTADTIGNRRCAKTEGGDYPVLMICDT